MSVVPWFVRALRDGVATLYNPFAKKAKDTARRRRATVRRQGGNMSGKPQAACRYCGKHYEAIRGVKIHENKCKSAPDKDKTNKKPKSRKR
jgi:hypothetical protein